jgi:hypothetical protein
MQGETQNEVEWFPVAAMMGYKNFTPQEICSTCRSYGWKTSRAPCSGAFHSDSTCDSGAMVVLI